MRRQVNGMFRSLGFLLLFFVAFASAQPKDLARPVVNDDGSVVVPEHVMPMSNYLNHDSQAYLLEHLRDMQAPSRLEQIEGVPVFMQHYLQRQHELLGVKPNVRRINGVEVFDYAGTETPLKSKRDKVLINLHGGGFMGCWPACAELESMPLAARGYRVISINYRQHPGHRFPAASEDVANVYQALLSDYAPENIGIYGCSAGGMLTSMSVAWFHKHQIPLPGAIGVLCAGVGLAPGGFGGDSVYTTAVAGEARNPPIYPASAKNRFVLPYLRDTDITDPLVSPLYHPDYLRAFPPTLLVSGTRATELSNVVYSHSQLIKHGVDAHLHIWEGMFHGFFYNIEVEESSEYLDVIDNFFTKYLGKKT
ncbi:MAG TPA: alpha/beta hydrolase fold domain-containing protein [Pseudomonadales bacterium]|nr:alpha/beta hydrolase fold domain-containing protein [Pseudomonadales bacterium]